MVQSGIELLVGVSAVAATITGLSIWQLRMTANDLKNAMETNTQNINREFKEFTNEIDRKLDSLDKHVDRKVDGVHSYVRDVNIKTDALKDDLHRNTVDQLNFKSALPNEFATRRELDEVKKRVVRLEGTGLNINNS